MSQRATDRLHRALTVTGESGGEKRYGSGKLIVFIVTVLRQVLGAVGGLVVAWYVCLDQL